MPDFLSGLTAKVNATGGSDFVDRIYYKKERALRKALTSSDQSADLYYDKLISDIDGIQTYDRVHFKGTINAYKLNEDNDVKQFSCPWEVGIKTGDIIVWDKTNTDWLVYLKNYEEVPYFRGQIKKCNFDMIFGNGDKIRASLRGPVESSGKWVQKQGLSVTDFNSSLKVWIPASKINLENINKYDKAIVGGDKYEIVARDLLSLDGIYQLALVEYFNDITEKVEEPVEEESITVVDPTITGQETVYCYDEIEYSIKDSEGGTWALSDSTFGTITYQDRLKCKVQFLSRKGNVILRFQDDYDQKFIKSITVKGI